MLVDEDQHFIFGQFLSVHSGLRIMNYDPVHPGPEEPLGVAYAARKKKKVIFFITMIMTLTKRNWKG